MKEAATQTDRPAAVQADLEAARAAARRLGVRSVERDSPSASWGPALFTPDELRRRRLERVQAELAADQRRRLDAAERAVR
jgi:hypothetical protein